MRLIVLAIALWAANHPHPEASLRQHRAHEPIVLESTLVVPEGWAARYDWDVPTPAAALSGPLPHICHIWAPPGTYDVELEIILARVREGTEREIEWSDLQEQFVIQVGPTIPIQPVRPPIEPPVAPRKPTQATYVYETEDQIVPRPIQAVLRTANSQGIRATAIDKDSRDQSGQIPDQYRRALGVPGRSVPYFVVEDEQGIITIIDNPTAEQVSTALGL